MITLKDFETKVSKEQPSNFLMYRHKAAAKRIEIRSVMRFIGINAQHKCCLDIGPGHGESLDYWHEQGALMCSFIDRDWWFYTHNILKSHVGYGVRGNHLWFLGSLPKNRYDLIYARGAIAANDRFHKLFGSKGLSWWLRRVDKLAAPEAIIIMGPFGHQPHWMMETLQNHGYQPLPFIEGHNNEKYPITWVKVIK